MKTKFLVMATLFASFNNVECLKLNKGKAAALNLSKDTNMFAQIDEELAQGEKNIDQGVMGRQLGVTKAVSMKLHMNELEKSIKSEIGQVEKLTDDQKNQEKQFVALQGEIKKVAAYVPKIEKLEKDLELLD